MSLKYAVQQITSNHYVLPKVGSMKVDVHAFLSEELYNETDEKLWSQIVNGASYEGVIGAYLMPDCHVGYGVPVGSVVVTEDTLIQAVPGYDISCGVLYMRVPELTAADVRGKYERERWVREVEKRVATGAGSTRPKLMRGIQASQVDDVLRFSAKALGISADLCERHFIPIAEGTDLGKIEKAYSKVASQLGSVGGGNHFIEMQVAEDQSVWVMVHCGSRGYGWQTANHFFYEGARVRGLPSNRREDSWLGIHEDAGKTYWEHHNAAANFAGANRHQIVHGIREATQEVFKADVEVFYDISHNMVQNELVVLPDGSQKRGFVHRKGSTRAFPAGHPDLVGTKWEKTGHPVCIPGSMYHGAAILFPEANAFKSGFSVNHGSGRIMARGDAQRKLAHRQEAINSEMSDVVRTFGDVTIEGIISNHKNIPLDECAHVYKDLDAVLDVLSSEGIARTAYRMMPVANIKGAD